MDNHAIKGLIANQADAEEIVLALVEAGVNPGEISISSAPTRLATKKSEAESVGSARNWRSENRLADSHMMKGEVLLQDWATRTERRTKAPEGATEGAVIGSVVIGILCVLASFGILALPGSASLISAGPILAALSGIGVGATVGSLLGAFIGAAIPDKKWPKIDLSPLQGNKLVLSASAHNETEAKCIADILKMKGAVDVSVS